MFKDGNSVEEGNLASYLCMWCKRSVLHKLTVPAQKTLGLEFKFCELLFSKNCEVVSIQTILHAKSVRK